MSRKPMPNLQLLRLTIAALLPSGNVSVAHAASRLAINPHSLRHHIARLGTSYREQVAQVRMARACQLLAKTDMPIREIARVLGFASAEGFGRTFLRRMKVRPQAFRLTQKVLEKQARCRGRFRGEKISSQ